VTWKQDGDTIFVGDIKLTYHVGMTIMTNGTLVLKKGYPNIKDGDTYICLIFNEVTFEDIPKVSYTLTLSGEEEVIVKVNDLNTTLADALSLPPSISFTEANDELVISSNSARLQKHLLNILKEDEDGVRFIKEEACSQPSDTVGWANAYSIAQECETKIRQQNFVVQHQTILIAIDFYVETNPGSWFAVTQLYISDMKNKIITRAYSTLTPLPIDAIPNVDSKKIQVSDSWWDSSQNMKNQHSNSVFTTMVALKDAYSILKERI
ncbi:unnamed protein product, partial [Meganyctiphanes norvegica]